MDIKLKGNPRTALTVMATYGLASILDDMHPDLPANKIRWTYHQQYPYPLHPKVITTLNTEEVIETLKVHCHKYADPTSWVQQWLCPDISSAKTTELKEGDKNTKKIHYTIAADDSKGEGIFSSRISNKLDTWEEIKLKIENFFHEREKYRHTFTSLEAHKVGALGYQCGYWTAKPAPDNKFNLNNKNSYSILEMQGREGGKDYMRSAVTPLAKILSTFTEQELKNHLLESEEKFQIIYIREKKQIDDWLNRKKYDQSRDPSVIIKNPMFSLGWEEVKYASDNPAANILYNWLAIWGFSNIPTIAHLKDGAKTATTSYNQTEKSRCAYLPIPIQPMTLARVRSIICSKLFYNAIKDNGRIDTSNDNDDSIDNGKIALELIENKNIRIMRYAINNIGDSGGKYLGPGVMIRNEYS